MNVYFNGKIFTGTQLLADHCVLTDSGKVRAIIPVEDMPDSGQKINLQGRLLAPAFIDLQIYGGNGRLFGEFPSPDALAATLEYCIAGGATFFLPTVATNSAAVTSAAIRSVQEYWDKGGRGVLGLHLEGPYINPAKRGAHLQQFIREPSLADVKALLSEGRDVIKMMTIAPECFPEEVLDYLLGQNIILSAGHSNATYTQACAAFDKGIRTATHLFNAMSPLQHREPGMVGAILDHAGVSVSVVADGHHVDFAAIRVAKKVLNERLFLITDAVAESPQGLYAHQLAGDKYVVADGTLSGSALTMLSAVKNCVRRVGIPLEESLRMASLYPARILGLGHRLGKIAPDFDENFVVLDENLELADLVQAPIP